MMNLPEIVVVVLSARMKAVWTQRLVSTLVWSCGWDMELCYILGSVVGFPASSSTGFLLHMTLNMLTMTSILRMRRMTGRMLVRVMVDKAGCCTSLSVHWRNLS